MGNPSDGELRSQRRLGGGGRESPIPTSGFMMSDSARAFPSQEQRPIESGVGLECLGPREERGLVPGYRGGHHDPGVLICYSLQCQYQPPWAHVSVQFGGYSSFLGVN